ncbi:thiamine pyrophosphate-binding protein [Pelosinus sp. UFO1]|uniref:thiamine pyrophosphate-binding protein n=1 Tax=Pelosinus sp. UFO1 TaxID=484770 RepID=UPI0004D14F78|nr:thiamine pyrophosphate-binding protein [Pelosinus sp. UFO1]AIF53726.1 Acetolactate synthase [Pelosinus sp. UFO1]
MKLSDYIVSFLVEKKITDVFGYPGGMVTHLMDSFDKYNDEISAHVAYHEQGAAFCACGYAQISNLPGVAYATSGPGATNLITGIANAYFDSIPCIFITGQVNTYESKGCLEVRQKGFQEMDVVSVVKSITKYAVKVTRADDIRYELEKAFFISMSNRPGPVLIDIPMNIQRAEIHPEALVGYSHSDNCICALGSIKDVIFNALVQAKRPIIIAGAGISSSGSKKEFQELINQLHIPVVTSMIGIDCLPYESSYNFGFIGAYGHRYANFTIAKSDLIISIGSRLDCRQTGSNRNIFAEGAKIIRIDIDAGETTNGIKEDDIVLLCDIKELIPAILEDSRFQFASRYEHWLNQCRELKDKLICIDNEPANAIVREISKYVPDDVVITTDVGQNQVWVAQDFEVKENQRVLFSGGHGAMGYSLPAAIGAYYASGRPVICFNGDGGLQMNIQELQFIARESIPIKIVLMNNHSLGMIRHFQEMYFDSNSVQTIADKGYTVPDFNKVAEAYGIDTYTIHNMNEIRQLEENFKSASPAFIHIICSDKTYVYPKLAMNKPIHDQEPLMDRVLFNKLISAE